MTSGAAGGRNKALFEIVPLPCQRCGRVTVPVALLPFLLGGGRTTVDCRCCDATHLLAVRNEGDGFRILYQRYTLKYPLDYYDENEEPPIARLGVGGDTPEDTDEEDFVGPILVYARKKRFSPGEVEAIWRSSSGRCHICLRRWRLKERGVRGWHIDHDIPHIGGGRDTERLSNFKIACARCNLKKGKGYTEELIRSSLGQLIDRLNATGSRALLARLRGRQ